MTTCFESVLLFYYKLCFRVKHYGLKKTSLECVLKNFGAKALPHNPFWPNLKVRPSPACHIGNGGMLSPRAKPELDTALDAPDAGIFQGAKKGWVGFLGIYFSYFLKDYWCWFEKNLHSNHSLIGILTCKC